MARLVLIARILAGLNFIAAITIALRANVRISEIVVGAAVIAGLALTNATYSRRTQTYAIQKIFALVSPVVLNWVLLIAATRGTTEIVRALALAFAVFFGCLYLVLFTVAGYAIFTLNKTKQPPSTALPERGDDSVTDQRPAVD